MSLPKPCPLYPTYDELLSFDILSYTELNEFLSAGEGWYKQHWQWGQDFLLYIGRNKSEHTYTRFRNEVEKFLLWIFLFKKIPLDEFRKKEILEYADFCWKPPVSWVALSNADRFVFRNGNFQVNKNWLPFRLQIPKSHKVDTPDKKKYKPSQQTLTATFTAVNAFYKHLINEEICFGNPVPIAKKDCRYFIADAQVKEVRRLSEAQWQYVLETAESLAEQDHYYERSLFVIAALKTLFLRISELSERKDWSPTMGHFWQDEHQNWWLKIFGKGRKLRDVTVPTQFIDYLKRYRSFRALPALPFSGDNTALVEKVRGQGGMTARHLSRLVQEVFDKAYEKMRHEQGDDQARKLKEASTHWLRHTGASMEIERGRALKDVSEDLGHASMGTTDSIYVQSENKKRADSGKTRTVD